MINLLFDELGTGNAKGESWEWRKNNDALCGDSEKFDVKITESPAKRSKFDRNDDLVSNSLNLFYPNGKSPQKSMKFDKNIENVKKNLNFSCENAPFFTDVCAIKGSDSSWVYMGSSILRKMSNNNQKTEEYLNKFNNSDLVKKISLD